MSRTSEDRSSILIIGCGYLGSRVARLLQASGRRVVVTTRDAGRETELRRAGADEVRLFDLASGETANLGSGYETIIYAVSPGRGGNSRLCFLDGPISVLESQRRDPPEKFIFASSTGVYEQHGGELVDELSPAQDESAGHEHLRLAEQKLIENEICPATILRFGGLYGPGRSPVDWIRSQVFREKLSSASGDAYMNWIHIEDAAAATLAALERGERGETYLIVDGHPVLRSDFYEYAARLAGIAPPNLWPGLDQKGKRCENHKMREQLRVKLVYPDYRVGLEASS